MVLELAVLLLEQLLLELHRLVDPAPLVLQLQLVGVLGVGEVVDLSLRLPDVALLQQRLLLLADLQLQAEEGYF